jgi:hypothetical protein
VWPTGETSFYPPTDGYFNLDPNAFGLDYGIFEEELVTEIVIGNEGSEVLTTFTTGDWTSQAGLNHFPPSATAAATGAAKRKARNLTKRDSTIVPAVCFAQCNNCLIEAQMVGKSPALCLPNSAFESDFQSCQSCVVANGDSTKATLQTYVEPQFEQFISFCQVQSAQPEQGSAAASTSTETVVPVEATQNVVVATLTEPTPTRSVQVTSQVPPNTNTAPVAISSAAASAPFSSATAGGELTSLPPSKTVGGSGSATSSGPVEFTANSSNNLHPPFAMIFASIFVCSVLSLLL